LLAGLCVGAAGAAALADKPAPQRFDGPIQFKEPHRMMKIWRATPTSPIVSMSDWMPYQSVGERGVFGICSEDFVYDAGGLDGISGAPLHPECDGTNYYWYFGATYGNPNNVSEMTLEAAGAGARALEAGWVWYQSTADEGELIAVLNFEDQDQVNCVLPTGGLGGWIFDFSPSAVGGWYTHISVGDWCADPNAADIGWDLPADGNGAYQWIIGSAYDEPTNTFTLATLAQPLCWNPDNGLDTDANGYIDDYTTDPLSWNQEGDRAYVQYDDDTPTDGVFDPAECYLYDFAGATCPNYWGNSVSFWSNPAPGGPQCSCPGDVAPAGTGNGVIDINDLAAMLSVYGTVPADPCMDIAAPTGGPIDINDLAALLAVYATNCPP
jgi:hypothetical protein